MEKVACNGTVENGEILNFDAGVEVKKPKLKSHQHFDKLEGELESALRERDRWEGRASELQKKLDSILANVNGCTSNTAQNHCLENGPARPFEDEIEGVRSSLEAAQLKNGVVEGSKAELEEQKNSELGSLSYQLQQAQNRVRELEETCKDNAGHIDYLRKQVEDAQSHCKEMVTVMEEKESKIQALESRVASLQSGLPRQSSSSRLDERKNSASNMEAVLELADELKVVHQRKYRLEGEIGQMGTDLRNARVKCQEQETEIHRLREELGKAFPRQRQIDEERGHLEWEKNELSRKLWESGERIGWLEAELDSVHHRKRELEHRGEELEKFKDKVYKYLPEAFVIRKEPQGDRSKNPVPMWSETREEHYVRVWFEIDVPWAHHVFLLGGFLNWEMALVCTWHDHGKWGVWVDIPRGRHEFRFMVDGQWRTSEQFERVPTEFGSENNVINVT